MSYPALTGGEKRAHMQALITRYFGACNAADAAGIAACFMPDGTHYFPPGMYGGAWRGARLIGERWAASVAAVGSAWTVDRIVCEPESDQAVIEWTHYKTRDGTVLRGDLAAAWIRDHPHARKLQRDLLRPVARRVG